MKSFVLAALSLISFSALAQTSTVEQRIEKRLERLNDLVRSRAHVYLTEGQKKDVLQNINLAISTINADQTNPNPNPNPNPYPTPQPQMNPAACGWFDGASQGIAQRGWHAFRKINGITFSLGFYGNNSTASQGECLRDIIFEIERNEYNYTVSASAASSCACGWFDGASNSISQRGWHMFYKVPLMTGGEVTLSSGFYLNNSTASEQECKRQLVLNNFVCPIR